MEVTTVTKTLNVYERLMLALRVLPAEGGSFREAIRVKQIRNMLALSDEEKEAINYREAQGMPNWDRTKEEPVEVAFEDADLDLIGLGFVMFEKSGKVPTNDEFIDLYLKFEDVVEATEV